MEATLSPEPIPVDEIIPWPSAELESALELDVDWTLTFLSLMNTYFT